MMFLDRPDLQLISWALVHSLWQGVLIAAAARLVLGLCKSANARSVAAYVALLLMALVPVATVTVTREALIATETIELSLPGPALTSGGVTLSDGTSGSTVEAPAVVQIRIKPYLPYAAVLWLIGVVFYSIQLLLKWLTLRRMRSGEPHADLQSLVDRLARGMGVAQTVQLLRSSRVKVPTVLGWLKPVIILPPAMLLNLSPQQVEMILAHELAHVRRYDYIANLLQTFVEALLFYHPAAWWLSRQVRIERENACDDEAVAISGNAVSYARALASLERTRQPQLAIGAGGGSLKNRVSRLIGAGDNQTTRAAGAWVLVAGIMMSGVVALRAGLITTEPRPTDDVAAAKRAQDLCSTAKTGPAAIPSLIASLGDDARIAKSVGCWSSGDWTPLLSTLDYPSPGEEAALGLASMGETAYPALSESLTSGEPVVRRNAAWAIGELRDGFNVDRSSVVPLLIEMVGTDQDASIRRAAAFALSEIKDRSATGVLIKALSDRDARVRAMAANALGEMKASEALDALRNASQDTDKEVRRIAQWAINEIAG